MGLKFMDSFDHYATADITEKWTTASGSGTIGAYGRNSTNGLRLGASTQMYVTATVLGGVDEVIVGVAVKPTWNGASMSSIIVLGSGSYWECGLMLLADLTVQPFVVASASYPGPGFTTQYGYAALIGSASAVALQNGVYAHVELRMKCHGSAGTCTVRINGTEVLALTGLDTLYQSATLTRVGLGVMGSGAGCTADFDDLVVMDTAGSLNNTFLGDATVSALYPDGPGNSTDWDDSTGASPPQNWANANEATPNDDTDYNATATINAKDTYTMQDCAAGADIRAVQILASVRKATEGPGQVKLVVRSNANDYDGAAQGIAGTSYSYVREVRETDPGSGSPAAAWSESGWNAVEIGLKKTA